MPGPSPRAPMVWWSDRRWLTHCDKASTRAARLAPGRSRQSPASYQSSRRGCILPAVWRQSEHSANPAVIISSNPPYISSPMNWISNVVRPKIRSFLRRETPENLWIKCPETGQLVFYKDVEANQFVIPSSNYHMRISAPMRLKSMFDGGEFEDIALSEVPVDPLKFRDERRYADRLKDARTKTGLQDAVKLGIGRLEGQMVTIAVQDFDFMGGSLGMAAGEAVITGLETAVRRQTPFIMFAASGGARMQEGILSLMQLPRTTVGVQMLREARKPY